jgi:predicted nucleic-acid-binding Zn-ribbon protein
MENKIKIKCPHCGFEYLPAEIYYPDSFLGKPDDITRDEKGKIDFYDGSSMNMEEEFTCLNCGCNFIVSGDITFTTKEIKQKQEDASSEDYIIKLNTKNN